MDFTTLRQLDASCIYTGQYGVNPVPTFREYCEFVRDLPITTNIELKTGVFEYPGIEEKIRDMIQEFRLEDKVILSSFNHFTILRMQKIAPQLKYGFLTEAWIIDAGKYCHSHGVPCYHPNFRSLTHEAVRELKQYGLEINTYTVNTEADARDLIEKGVDTLIGNYPEMIRNVLAAGASK